MAESPKCACGCGAVLTRKSKTGPAPTYASDLCRVRAHRRRHAIDHLEPYPGMVHAERIESSGLPSDDQVQNAILEARTIAFAFSRLGREARPEFAWRCSNVGAAIIEILEKHFGKV